MTDNKQEGVNYVHCEPIDKDGNPKQGHTQITDTGSHRTWTFTTSEAIPVEDSEETSDSNQAYIPWRDEYGFEHLCSYGGCHRPQVARISSPLDCNAISKWGPVCQGHIYEVIDDCMAEGVPCQVVPVIQGVWTVPYPADTCDVCDPPDDCDGKGSCDTCN